MTADDRIELGEAGGLAYRSAGEGRPLVLLHPGPGLDGSVFFPEVLTLTGAGVRVVALDLPANGRSPARDPAEWTIAGYTRSVMRAVRALGFGPREWDLLGHSFGGYVALALIRLHPGELTRLIASCTDGSEARRTGRPARRDLPPGGRGDRGRVGAGERGDDAGGAPRRLARPARLLRRHAHRGRARARPRRCAA